ncbi:hypothetical protein TNCV_2456211 [Trichonephila clavipes]|nr:hypothetical protein TNCV_2456211 [Trichonephila clavipes]
MVKPLGLVVKFGLADDSLHGLDKDSFSFPCLLFQVIVEKVCRFQVRIRLERRKVLEEQPGPSSKRDRVFITCVIRPPVAPVLIASPSTALVAPQPVSIPEPPVLTAPQILLQNPPRPPELTTPLVQIPDPPVQIPVFQPPVHISPVPTAPPVQIPDPPRPPELTTPIVQMPVFQPPVQISPVPTTPPVQLFYQIPPPVQVLLPDPPPVVETLEPTFMDDSSMDQIMASVFGDCSPQGILRLIPKNPSHLNLTWDKGFELRFFQVCRPPSHRVWEAHQLQTTDEYILDFADCTRVADVYVKWLMWLDDWEMHREDNVPWRMVGLQLWKRALEKHVQHSHEKALANGMPSDVTLLEHIYLFCTCQRVSSRWQASAHRIVHCHDSQGWQRSRNHVHDRESWRTNFQAQRFSIQLPRECPSASGTPPVTQECARGIPALLSEGQVKSAGPRQQGPDGGQRSGATKFFSRARTVCHGPGEPA